MESPLLSSTVDNGSSGGEKRIKHYSDGHRILLVGEGDFSFAVCLARAFGSASNLVATSLDSQADLMVKHPNAMGNVNELKERGCIVIHGVNACSMNQHEPASWPLSEIVRQNCIQFSSCRFFQERMFTRPNPDLVKGFLRNARMMVADNGEVHVTHKTAYPFCQWKIQELANEKGLILVEEARFYIWDYPGYHNKRGDGPRSNETFPVEKCSTFKFRKSPIHH